MCVWLCVPCFEWVYQKTKPKDEARTETVDPEFDRDDVRLDVDVPVKKKKLVPMTSSADNTEFIEMEVITYERRRVNSLAMI